MRGIFDQVLNMSLSGGWVILLVLAARLVLRKAPARFRYVLWGLVLLRLLCPFSLESRVSLIPPHESAAVNLYTPEELVSEAFPPEHTADTVTVEAGEYTASFRPAALRRAVLRTLRAVWPLGMAAVLAGGLFSLGRLRRRLIGAVPLRENIWLADHIGTAFVLGTLHPRIYLPSVLPPEEQEFILLHEQTHLRRRDPIWKLLGFFVLAVHWFNPLVWFAMRCAERDMELSCDEAVLARLGPEIRQAYAASLLRLSAGKGIGIAFGESSVKQRILNVLRYQRPRLLISLAGAIAVILLACGLLTDPVKAIKPEDTAGQFYRMAEGWLPASGDFEAPKYFISEGHCLYEIVSHVAYDCGVLRETEAGNDQLVTAFMDMMQLSPEEQEKILQNTERIWHTSSDNHYIVFLQKDGSVYIGANSMESLAGDVSGPFFLQMEAQPEPEAAIWKQTYYVSEIAYENPVYSFGYTLSTAPVYTLQRTDHAPFRLFCDDGGRLTNCGIPREITLTKAGFEESFHPDYLPEGFDPASIREDAVCAWECEKDGVRYDLILQRNGQLWLACYLDSEQMRWLFVLSDTRPDVPATPIVTVDAAASDSFDMQQEPSAVPERLSYQEAYQQLLSYRIDGFSEQAPDVFRYSLAPDVHQADGLLAAYNVVAEALPVDSDPNADFFLITLKASFGELCSEEFGQPYMYAFDIVERRGTADPESGGVLAQTDEISFMATCTVAYTLDGTVTVGERDNMLKGLKAHLRGFTAALSEEALRESSLPERLRNEAEEYFRDNPQEGMEISAEVTVFPDWQEASVYRE